MNVPNSLTMARMILIVPFVIILLNNTSGNGRFVALAIFILASMTDWLDGYLARKNHLVTNFGKFMDPLADKLLVSAAMISLVSMNRLPAWVVIIIISREFAISGFRLIASDNGIVIAAGWWGKCKTVSQMIMIILLIADLGGVFTLLEEIFIWLALALTVISLIDYIWKNRQVLNMQS
ncbi:MAG: CDP-diacylglycerol--glycerol-3-phosphate 3-phosphatidyltransferase [Eubacteriales bacterium]|nr:CDP-diacylglycerol--glycerol-3-phosphate 3-phosphatidyltransferase [Eubacteriales bacterium]